MKHEKKGMIISVAGIDGCGKSTLMRHIARYLDAEGYDFIRTSAISENCTHVGRRIGTIMTDPNLEGILPQESEGLLMLAARVENWENVIHPALREGKIVLSDRFQSCFAIYQDLDNAVAKRRLMEFGLNRDADIEFIMDIDPRHVHGGFDSENNRLEKKSMTTWDDMRMRYRQVAQDNNWAYLIDAHKPDYEVWEQVAPLLVASLKQRAWIGMGYKPLTTLA